MKRATLYLFFLSLLSSLAVVSASSTQTSPIPADHTHATASTSRQFTGDDVFKANCGRCHTPPMSLSPRIAGTIIMHMRTRARLSRRDEQLLLKYLAP